MANPFGFRRATDARGAAAGRDEAGARAALRAGAIAATLDAAASRRAALEPTPEPPAEAGPVCIATNVGVSAVQRVDAGRDEPEHRGKRRRTRCCAVEDEDRENRNDRDQRKEDAAPVL